MHKTICNCRIGVIFAVLFLGRVLVLNTMACPMMGQPQQHKQTGMESACGTSPEKAAGHCSHCKVDQEPSGQCEGNCCPTCKNIVTGKSFLPASELVVKNDVPVIAVVYTFSQMYATVLHTGAPDDDVGYDITRPLNVPLRL